MTSDLPPPDSEAVPTDDEPPRRSPRRGRPARRRGANDTPNYTARRVAVGSALVAVLAIGAFAVASLTGGDDEDSSVVEPGWDAIVEVSRSDGDVTVLDPDGDEIARLDGSGRVAELHVRAGRAALVGPGTIVITDLADEADATVVEIDRATSVVRHPSNRSFTLVVTPDVAGEVTVVDGESGDTVAIGERAGQSAPLLLAETLRLDRSGTRIAIGDGRNFQTIVVDVDDEVETGFFPGVPMAVGDDLVVTSTNVGRSAELGFFDREGERLGLVPTERPVAGVLDGDRFVYVTEDGRVLAAEVDRAEPSELGELDVGTISRVVPVDDGRRLLVDGTRSVVVVDLDGGTVAEGDPDEAFSTLVPWSTWRCLPLPGADGGSIVDLRDGEPVADLPVGEIVAVSTDGCGVHVRRTGEPSGVDANRNSSGGTTDDDATGDATGGADDDSGEAATGDVVVSRAGTYAPRSPVRSVALAPDGSAAVVVATDWNAELVTIADGRRLDLGERRGLLALTER